MTKPKEEISRFSASGKTFFFNKGEARNGTNYLRINGLYGRGNKEGLNVFSSHYLEFYKHVKNAIAELTGFEPTDKTMVEKCPHCNAGPAKLRVAQSKSGEQWCMYCGECMEILFENVPSAYEDYIKKEKD